MQAPLVLSPVASFAADEVSQPGVMGVGQPLFGLSSKLGARALPPIQLSRERIGIP